MSAVERLTIEAPAKINLLLKVLGKRPDGYHEIYSLVQAISLYDTLSLTGIDSGIEIVSDSPDFPLGSDNLIWKAVALLQQELGFKGGVRVEVTKRIPMGAGLGGGSSDAAATMKGVNRLFDLNLSNREMQTLGGRLGSDIPFFFSSGSAIITGRGEMVEDVDLDRSYHVLLVKPDFSIQTVWAYSQLRFCLTNFPPLPTLVWEVLRENILALPPGSGNDFQEMVANEFPGIRVCMKTLSDTGAKYVAVSGSGSAFFGLYDRPPDAELMKLIRNRFGWQVYSLYPVSLV